MSDHQPSLQQDYAKCMIKTAFRPERCSKCSDETACSQMQWHQKQAEKREAEKQTKKKG